jgi:hypothetical protein
MLFHCSGGWRSSLWQPVLRSRSRGAEIKLPPVAVAEIVNCVSSSGSGSFLFAIDLKKFYRKIMVAEEVSVNCYNFNPIT